MGLSALQFLGGLVLLLVGGRLLVSASVDTARRLGVSPLVVGLTLVAWGTSAPELALNLVSAFKGRGELALGNVVGANICNMGLVLGVCALMRPLRVEQRLINVEIWLNAAVLLFMATLGLVLGLPAWAAGVMLGVFGVYSTWTIMSALRAGDRARAERRPEPTVGEDPTIAGSPPMGWWMIAACFVGGLVLLSVGGTLASDGAAGAAVALGIPAAVVGVTIVSIGTTLPEMVTSVLAVRKGQTDLAMGNCIGSCLFNAGAIFGVAGLIAPVADVSSLAVPLAFMGAFAVALVPIARTFGKTVSRLEGGLLLAGYAAFLIVSAVRAV